MKKLTIIGSLVLLMLALGLPALYAQQQQQGIQAQAQDGGWYCPWGGRGQGARMRQGGGMGMWCNMQGPCAMVNQNQGKPLTKEQASQLLQNYVQRMNNPNVKLGDVTEKGDVFEATIVTKKEGSLVQKIQVNKSNGWFKNVS